MTPQSPFTVIAPVDPDREDALRALLASMTHRPGMADPDNHVVPFGRFETLHFARFVILEDHTAQDLAAHGVVPPVLPTYLAFLGDCDGSADACLADLARRADEGLRRVFSHCRGFDPGGDLLGWLRAHRCPPAANYVNWVGRTVRQVREESALRQMLEEYLTGQAAALADKTPRQVWGELQAFVERERRAGRLVLTPEAPAPLGWRLRNAAHLVGVPVVLLLLAPLLLLYLPVFAVQLRRRERRDPVIAPGPEPERVRRLAALEDHDVSNQFSAMGSLKPGRFRRWTVAFLLWVAGYGTRHLYNRGRLARVHTIHAARWVFLDDKRRLLFASNYDGSLESYNEDFINKVSWGLNLVFSNGVGYPRTRWLVLDGARYEQQFKNYIRRHQLATEVWYNAHPGLTALNLERNTLIRQGIEREAMSDAQARQWLQLFV